MIQFRQQNWTNTKNWESGIRDHPGVAGTRAKLHSDITSPTPLYIVFFLLSKVDCCVLDSGSRGSLSRLPYVWMLIERLTYLRMRQDVRHFKRWNVRTSVRSYFFEMCPGLLDDERILPVSICLASQLWCVSTCPKVICKQLCSLHLLRVAVALTVQWAESFRIKKAALTENPNGSDMLIRVSSWEMSRVPFPPHLELCPLYLEPI